MKKPRTRTLVVTGVAVAAIGAGSVIGVASATGGESLDGDVRDRAVTAALAHVGQGTVTEAEKGDSPGVAYEVEVRRPDGSQIEVGLDQSFRVVGTEPDDDGPGDEDGPGDRDEG